MIQFNLLPDVKLEFIKARRNQRLVIGGSLLVIAACAFVMIMLLTIVFVGQRKHLSDLNGDIAQYTQQLKNTADLDKILTVQNQLKALPGLHDSKPAATRLYNYVQQVTPASATISQLNVDYDQSKITITGNTSTLDVVNVFTDTLKFTNYKATNADKNDKGQPAFKNVVLTQFSRTTSGSNYTIDADFDPAIFDIKQSVGLVVPNIISTRSATEQPTALFQSNVEAGNQ